jgi:hypothetical protein
MLTVIDVTVTDGIQSPAADICLGLGFCLGLGWSHTTALSVNKPTAASSRQFAAEAEASCVMNSSLSMLETKKKA